MLSLKAFFALSLVLLIVSLQLVCAMIRCNESGECAGSGLPAYNVRCGVCHSCTFEGCCHVRFTDPYTKCYIAGWRSKAYEDYYGQGN